MMIIATMMAIIVLQTAIISWFVGKLRWHMEMFRDIQQTLRIKYGITFYWRDDIIVMED